MKDFAAIDFETANNQRSSVCSVGIVVVRNDEIVDTFYSLINPEPNYYSYWCSQVHGLTREDTENAPGFVQVWEEIERTWLDEFDTLVAHNAAFDRSCLISSARLYNIHLPDLQWKCSMQTARRIYSFGCNSLEYLCRRLGIPEGAHHRAGDDAEMCARLFIREASDIGKF